MAMDKEREALMRVCQGMIDIVERVGCKDWRDQHGRRLKDTKEWVEFYVTVHRAAEQAALTAQQEPVEGVHIIFDGPPSHESGRFVEVETPDGRSISWGRWEQRGKYWHLIAPPSGVREDVHKRLMSVYHSWRQGENRQIDSHWAAMSLLSAMLPPDSAAEQVDAEWMRDLGRSPETALEIEQAAIIRELKSQPADGVVVPRIVTDEMREVAEKWARTRPHIYVQELWNDLLAAAKEKK